MNNKKYHFIGIGGEGMSPIAEILKTRGCSVSGSDATERASTIRLRNRGIAVNIGHSASHISDQDVVVYSAAIPNDNEELRKAKETCKECIVRSEMLGRLMKEYEVRIAVAGTHGKTTTTTMIDAVLSGNGYDNTSVIGAAVPALKGSNARIGKSNKYFLTEACEAFESFLDLRPSVAVITNIDADHLDYYGTLDRIKEAFSRFLENLDADGAVIYCRDNENAFEAAKNSGRPAVGFGFCREADVYADNIEIKGEGISFDVYKNGLFAIRCDLGIPGRHNVLNALACFAVCDHLGVSSAGIKKVLEAFSLPSRRFNVRRLNGGMLIDDYAHHPTEIGATMDALKEHYPGKRITVVFQPHLYSRTRDHLKGFVDVLTKGDRVIVTDIYAAREKPVKGVDGKMVNDAVLASGFSDSSYMPKNLIPEYLKKTVGPDDIAIVFGAGDINSICGELADE
ncbi:MAG: UDP-N-acetylmuramate--L-alanine ligase [Abditibacteriota bacterium]|nr:UDP-N-acetylmuramate--L-alanine ligase [Abditibacteriota bacterium]